MRKLVLVLVLVMAMLALSAPAASPAKGDAIKVGTGWAEGYAFPSVSLDVDVWYTSTIKIKGNSTLPGKKVVVSWKVWCYDADLNALPVLEKAVNRVPDDQGNFKAAIPLPTDADHCAAWIGVVDKKARKTYHRMRMTITYVADKVPAM